MQARFLRDALNGDLAAGHLVLKICERRAAALGPMPRYGLTRLANRGHCPAALVAAVKWFSV